MHQFAGYLLQRHAFDDAVSAIWHAKPVRPGSTRRPAKDVAGQPARHVTLRIFDLPESGQFAGPLFAYREDVEAAAQLHHPHVLETLDVGRYDAHTYAVNRHTPAAPLSEHLRRTLTPAQAAELLAPLADALDTAARSGLAHGAVHPRSIWVEPDPNRRGAQRALLTGFGLHHVLRVLAARRRDGGAVDDFLYIAPELVRGGRPTNRSDQYALAAALLHATTGEPPFRDDRLAALLHAQRFGRPPSIGRDIDGVAALDEVLARALAKNPEHRFDSCGDFFAAVTAWARDHRKADTVEVQVAVGAPDAPSLPAERGGAAVAPPGESPFAPVQEARLRRRATRRRNPSPVMRGAPALAAAGVIIGTIAALVLLARLPSSPGSGDLAAASAPEAAPASSVAPGLRWRQALDAPVIGVHVVDAGVVAVTPEHVVVLDSARGRVRATLDSRQTSAAVTADGALVTAGTDGLQLHDLADRSVQWSSDITGAGPPEIMGQTVYRVSDQGVPRLIALAAASGQRLWRYPDDERALSADTVVVPGDDLVYLADDDAVLGVLPEGAAIDADTAVIDAGDRAGEPVRVWQATSDEPLWPSSMESVAGGVVTADRSGDVCLRRSVDGETVWCAAAEGVANADPTLLAGDGSVYVVTGAAVTALDAGTGEQRWERAGSWREAVLAGDGRLVAVENTGVVSMLAASTGTVRTLDAVRLPSGALLAVGGGGLYAAGDDGTVVSVDLEDTGDERRRVGGMGATG